MSYDLLLDAVGKPPVPRRTPLTLPICSSCPSPYSYDKIIPPGSPVASRDWLRADAWTMVVPNLTPVDGPGGIPWALTYLFDLWGPADQQRLMDGANIRGYTHFYLSWPDSDLHVSRKQFVDSMRRVKANGLYVHVKLAAKSDPHDMTFPQFQAFLTPILDSVLSSGVCDEASFWEYDLWNLGGQTSIDIHRWVGALAHQAGCSFWGHFSSERTFWADNFTQFWTAVGHEIDGIDYQADPYRDIGWQQSRIVDVLDRLAAIGLGQKCRGFEICADRLFETRNQDEDQSNVLGYLISCTRGADIVWGFGNGARRLDGWPL